MGTPFEKARKQEMRAAIKTLMEEHPEWSINFIAKTLKDLHGDRAYSRGKVYKWAKRFKSGYLSTDDESHNPRHERTATDPAHIERAEEIIRDNKHITVRPITFTWGYYVRLHLFPSSELFRYIYARKWSICSLFFE